MRVRVVTNRRRVLLSVQPGSTVACFSQHVASICDLEEAPALFLDGFRLLENEEAAQVLREDDTVLAGGIGGTIAMSVGFSAKRQCVFPAFSTDIGVPRCHDTVTPFLPRHSADTRSLSCRAPSAAPSRNQPRPAAGKCKALCSTAAVKKDDAQKAGSTAGSTGWELPRGIHWPPKDSLWIALDGVSTTRPWKGDFLRYRIVEFKGDPPTPTMSNAKVGYVDQVLRDPLRLVLVDKRKSFDVVEATSIHQPHALRHARKPKAQQNQDESQHNELDRHWEICGKDQIGFDQGQGEGRLGVEAQHVEDNRAGDETHHVVMEGRGDSKTNCEDFRENSVLDANCIRHPLLGDLEVPQGESAETFVAMKLRRLRQAIKRQIEYYFSDENISKDNFLRSAQDADGYVSLTLVCSFNRVQSMCADRNFIIASLDGSDVVELYDNYIRRRPELGRT